MKTLLRKIYLIGCSVVFAVCGLFLALVNIHSTDVKAGADTDNTGVVAQAQETTKVTLTGVHSFWNNYVHDNTYCSILEFNGGIAVGNIDGDYTDVFAKATVNGNPVDANNLSFVCRAWVDGQGDSIVMRWKKLPASGSILHIPAGSTFRNGGVDTNLYEVQTDIYLQLNGATWAPCDAPAVVETTPVTFNQINIVWNNYAHPEDGAHCTFLEFDGGISGNGNLDANFSDLLTKMTINGEAVDTNNLSIYCPNWIGAEGGIVLRFETNPEAGAEMLLPAGATFTIGGMDTNVYKIQKDVNLRFDGAVWVPYETYGTPTFTTPIPEMVGPWGWNHNTTSDVNKNENYGYTIVAQWQVEVSAVNLAETDSLTSRSITLNGKSFYELYQEDDGYRLNAQLEGYFAFSVPTSALVADNGYEYPTIEIKNGTPFYAGNYLPATTLIYKDGAWQLGENVNTNPSFVGIGDINHLDNPALNAYGLSVRYDATDFTDDGVQVMATSYIGFTLNGEMQTVALWGGDQLLFWMTKENCAAGYNGYSHATLEITNGAKIVNADGKEYTLGGVTLYLVNGAWTTQKPADYVVKVPEALQPTEFVGLDASSTKTAIVLTYADDLTWTEDMGNIHAYVLLDGGVTLAQDGGSVSVDIANKTLTVNVVGEYSKMQILANGNVAGMTIPTVSVYATETAWSLDPQMTNALVGVGVFGNNNLPTGTDLYHTVLQFANNFVIGDSIASDPANMAASTAYEVASKVKLNGKSFYELYQADNRFYIGYMAGGPYMAFQIPQSYLDGAPENGYDYHTIEIEAGTVFMDMLLPESTLISLDKVWLNADNFDPTPLPYTGIPYGWNYVQNGAYVDTILQFGEYGVDFLGADNGVASHADPTNFAPLANEPIANRLTINGVAVKDIAGVTVSYAHGYNFLYISIPVYELYPNDAYKCVELHLQANTVFKNSVLSEVTLYLLNGQWTTEKPATVDTDAAGSYLTAKDIFNGVNGGYYANGVYALTADADKMQVRSSAQAGANGVIFNFLYKSTSADFDYNLSTGVTAQFGGVRLTVFHNEGEDQQGFNLFVNGRFEGAQQVAFAMDEWYAIRIATAVENGKLTVSVAVDGVVVLQSETDYNGGMGDVITLTKVYGALSFADYKTGDIKRPMINWQGKDVYYYTAGENKPNDSVFMQFISATDNYDKSNFTASNFTVQWEDGAVNNGKLVAGDWTVTFVVRDSAGNTAYFTIMASVASAQEITVSFNVGGEVVSVVNSKGELLEQPAEPTKAGDMYANYIFDGWYVDGQKWDFANDYTFENIELVAVFTMEYKEYTVTLTSEGLANGYTYTLKLHFNSTLDECIFARDGYTYTLTNNGQAINKVTVNGDMQVKVVYTATSVDPETPGDSSSVDSDTDSASDSDTASTSSEEKKSGCKGSVDGAFMGLALACLASACVFVKSSTKVGKEDE